MQTPNMVGIDSFSVTPKLMAFFLCRSVTRDPKSNDATYHGVFDQFRAPSDPFKIPELTFAIMLREVKGPFKIKLSGVDDAGKENPLPIPEDVNPPTNTDIVRIEFAMKGAEVGGRPAYMRFRLRVNGVHLGDCTLAIKW